MSPTRTSLLPFAGAALAAALLTPAQGSEPTAQELIALAPVLNSSDRDCRSLDVGGYLGSDNVPGPRLRFRALYQAPNQFSMLISDAADGTPLCFCSGRNLFVYDPVGPILYYSEVGNFTLEAACNDKAFMFKYQFLMTGSKPHRILVDFPSMLAGPGRAVEGGDKVVKIASSQSKLIRSFGNKPYLTLEADPTKACPYTSFVLLRDGNAYLSFDRLVLDRPLADDLFAFPARRRLPPGLPVQDVTEEDSTAPESIQWVIERASWLRSLDKARPATINLPGVSRMDWARVKENDKKFSKALKDLVPPNLLAP